MLKIQGQWARLSSTLGAVLALTIATGCSSTLSNGNDGGTADGSATDSRSTDATPSDATPSDATPTDTTTADATSADTAAADSASADSTAGVDSTAGADSTAADASSPTGAYPARPPAGKLYWGAAINGNGDPVARHETPSGHTMVIRRTFFQWSQRTGSMITMASGDLAAGRLPWVSVKTPSWAEMGNGTHDAAIDQMLKALDALSGPVWLTVHHEPEGGGASGNTPDDPAGPAGHLAMNKRVRARMTALGVDNVALAPILMSWTWNAGSGRDPEQWWAPGVYDFVGIDHYTDAEASLLTSIWYKVRAWAETKGVEIAVGEWGMRGTDAAAGQRVKDWYDDAAGSHADGKGARVVGLCAFDSGLNSPSGSWELKGAQLTTFQSLLNDPRTIEWTSLP